MTASAVDDPGYPFKPGDHVMLTKGADVVESHGKTMYIYKKDMVVCKIQEGSEK